MIKNLEQRGYLNQEKRLKKEMKFFCYIEQEITCKKWFCKSVYALGKKNSTKMLAMKKPNTCHVLFAVKFYKGSFPLHFYGISLFAF